MRSHFLGSPKKYDEYKSIMVRELTIKGEFQSFRELVLLWGVLCSLFIHILFLSNSYAKEIPGKTVLFPYRELVHYNFKQKPYRILFREQEIKLVSLDKVYNIKFADIDKLSLVKEIPRLRGKLIEEFEQEDLAFLSKVYLRVDLKEGIDDHVNEKLNKELNTESNEVTESIFITLDFNLTSQEQLEALEENINQINQLRLKSNLSVRSKDEIFRLQSEYSREFIQYPLDIESKKKRILPSFFKELSKRLKKSSAMNYHTRDYHMAKVVWESLDATLKHSELGRSSSRNRSGIRLRQRSGSRDRFHELRARKTKLNAWKLKENLHLRNLLPPDNKIPFKRLRLQDEFCSLAAYSHYRFCAHSFLGSLLSAQVFSNFKERYQFIENYLNDLKKTKFPEFQSYLSSRDKEYIHQRDQEILNQMVLEVYALDDFIEQTQDLAKKLKEKSYQDIVHNLLRVRIALWSQFANILISHGNYNITRFYNEGHFYKAYPERFFTHILFFLARYRDDVHPFNWAMVEMSELADDAQDESFLSHDTIKNALDDLVANDLEKKGTELGEGVVNIMGQIFKKRKWVPYLRVQTMFRENYMTEKRDEVYKTLFSSEGIKPGDIILEKDRQANTDVLIPGYWIHAALYVGTIKDLKRLGLWDDPQMAIIRHEIELYQKSEDRQYYLQTVWGNKLSFEEIPWFYESDRPGVAVHPLHKFMQTDGMAVLRANQLGETKLREIFYRANERMYFPYDYVHNVRNKFSVSCSKVILKIFNDITFPVTQYLSYVSVSPDQIGQAVSKNYDIHQSNGPASQLRLIFFFDAEDEGRLKFHHKRVETHSFYSKYLKLKGY